MGKREKLTFDKVIDEIKKDENNLAILLVGSSKNKDLMDENLNINDIDLFIIRENQVSNQIREFIKYNDIEFDLNYFSIKSAYKYIEKKEKFFIKALSNPNIVFDSENISADIIKKCKIEKEKL